MSSIGKGNIFVEQKFLVVFTSMFWLLLFGALICVANGENKSIQVYALDPNIPGFAFMIVGDQVHTNWR